MHARSIMLVYLNQKQLRHTLSVDDQIDEIVCSVTKLTDSVSILYYSRGSEKTIICYFKTSTVGVEIFE